jgi:hypothetical protein
MFLVLRGGVLDTILGDKVCQWLATGQGMSYGKGMESANKYARKWPILPFDVSRDFLISKEILV